MHNRGQATVFIILAILGIVAAYAIFSSTAPRLPERQIPGQIATTTGGAQSSEIRGFIQDCVDITTQEAVEAFGLFGGEWDETHFPISIETNGYSIPLYFDSGKVNLPSNKAIEQDILSPYVNHFLPECLSELQLPDGVTLKPGKLNTSAKEPLFSLFPTLPIDLNILTTTAHISPSDVRFSVNYPLIVEGAGQQSFLSEPYTSIVKAPLGQMIDLSRKVVDSHVKYPSLVDWPTIYGVNHDGAYNFTYLFPNQDGKQVDKTVVYQLTTTQPKTTLTGFTLLFGARYQP